MIYFDNAATTYPKAEEVYQALDYANRHLAFNAGRGNYKESSSLSLMIDECRKSIASFVNASKDNVVFTSSATESLNLIINGLDIEEGDYVYLSPFEHNAIVRPLYNLKKKINFEIIILPFNKKTWKPELEKINEMFNFKRPKAIFLSQISNVTGLELDYINIFELGKKYNSVTVLDSAQAFGVVNPNLNNVDFCVFAGHKSLYASYGIAGFIFKDEFLLKVVKSGGNGSDSLNHNMPEHNYNKFEAGSLNSVAIYGLLKSTEWIKKNNIKEKEEQLTNYLISELEKLANTIVYLPEDKKVFGIVSINIKGYTSDEASKILSDEFNILTRSGYHCAPFVHDFLDNMTFYGTLRIGLSYFNTFEEIDTLINSLKSI